LNIQGVVLNAETKLAALLLAEASFQKYSKVFGHYRNTANSHLVGRLGEFATFAYLRDQNLNPIAHFLELDKIQNCDIDSTIGRIEVKTWKAEFWDDWGRCVSVNQIASLRRKADLIVWCVADEIESDNPKIEFKGWNEVCDIENLEPKMTGKEGRQIFNYQFDEASLNPIDSLPTREINEQGRNIAGSNSPNNG
jgi:hypothetical protein